MACLTELLFSASASVDLLTPEISPLSPWKAGFINDQAVRGTLQAVTSDPMLQDTRIALFLLAELVAALRANDPDTFKRWLYGGIEDLGEPAVTELLLDWPDPFINRLERGRLVAWHLGMSL